MTPRTSRRDPGFTLLELMVVVAVIAVLVGLLLPALAKARFTSRQVKGSATLRQLGVHVSTYSSDHHDLMPRIEPNAFYPVGHGNTIQYPYWQCDETWILVLHQQLPIWENADLIYCPGGVCRAPTSTPRLTSYAMSWAFAAGPSLWRRTAPDVAAINYRVRQSDIVHPSRKVLLWDIDPGCYGRNFQRVGLDVTEKVAVQTSDLSVTLRVPMQATEPVANTLWFTPNAMRLRNTENGVAGHDF